MYHKYNTYLYGKNYANSADPDLTAHKSNLIRIYTIANNFINVQVKMCIYMGSEYLWQNISKYKRLFCYAHLKVVKI